MRLMVFVVSALLAFGGCTRPAGFYWRAQPVTTGEVANAPSAAWLKCYLRDGRLYLLDRWSVDAKAKVLHVRGKEYDAQRELVGPVETGVPFADIALLETNEARKLLELNAAAKVGLGILGGVIGTLTIVCSVNPKACFGSCPTIYAHDGRGLALQAEGFSASVAPALEATDIDAMPTARSLDGHVELEVRNEAFETHYLRWVRVLAVARPAGARILRAGDRYLPASSPAAPLRCTSEQGDCTADVADLDEREWKSPADATDLAARETLELELPDPGGHAGLLVTARNTLLNTFLFYQGLAWLGSRAGERLARAGEELPGPFGALWRELGAARVEVLTSRGWVQAGAFDEVGPIAREVTVVPLPDDRMATEGRLRVRISMTRGWWRLDRLASVRLGPAIAPTAVDARVVLRDGRDDPAALATLADPGTFLVTLPGDAYTLVFDLPPGEQELFVETRGYYVEWMRPEWLAEEDPAAALRLFAFPGLVLRELAPRFKALEPSMDAIFWKSRFGAAP